VVLHDVAERIRRRRRRAVHRKRGMGQVDPTEESHPIPSHRGTLETTSCNQGVSGWVWVDGHGRNYLLRVLTATDWKRVMTEDGERRSLET
jgi:hypothetical protein